ncbi:hypothetical protein WI40_16740 [Burkholderia ubonensis]|nr:hypothetical protein WI40_16740 [Burkholderia ubonensis]
MPYIEEGFLLKRRKPAGRAPGAFAAMGRGSGLLRCSVRTIRVIRACYTLWFPSCASRTHVTNGRAYLRTQSIFRFL